MSVCWTCTMTQMRFWINNLMFMSLSWWLCSDYCWRERSVDLQPQSCGFLRLLRVLRCWWEEASRQINRLSGYRIRGGGTVWRYDWCASVTDNYSNVFPLMLRFLTHNNSDTPLQRACLVSFLSWLQIIPDNPRLGKICNSDHNSEFF